MSPVSLPILMYHAVSAHSSAAFRRFAVPPGLFGEQISALRDAGYETLTVAGYVARRRHGTLPPRPLLLTFDDAFEDFALQALPVLERCGFVSTLYVPTAYVGGTARWLEREGEAGRPMLDWNGLREVQRRGTECGGHSHTHPSLDQCPLERLRREVQTCQGHLTQELGPEARSFCYPYGHHNRRVRQEVAAGGFVAGCATGDLVAQDRWAPLWALPRLTVTREIRPEALLATLEQPSGALARWRSAAWRRASRLYRQAMPLDGGRSRSPE